MNSLQHKTHTTPHARAREHMFWVAEWAALWRVDEAWKLYENGPFGGPFVAHSMPIRAHSGLF